MMKAATPEGVEAGTNQGLGFIATFDGTIGIEETDSDFRNQVRQPSFSSNRPQATIAFTMGTALLGAKVKP